VRQRDLGQLGAEERTQPALAAGIVRKQMAPRRVVAERGRERAAQRLDLVPGGLADLLAQGG
jgi:hypothetical protein